MKSGGKYFVFMVEAYTKRYALVVNDFDKIRAAFSHAVGVAKETYPDENLTDVLLFYKILGYWYYSKNGSSPNEAVVIDAIAYALEMLSDSSGDCGLNYYLSTDKSNFVKIYPKL